jgi:hypothetical protein
MLHFILLETRQLITLSHQLRPQKLDINVEQPLLLTNESILGKLARSFNKQFKRLSLQPKILN